MQMSPTAAHNDKKKKTLSGLEVFHHKNQIQTGPLKRLDLRRSRHIETHAERTGWPQKAKKQNYEFKLSGNINGYIFEKIHKLFNMAHWFKWIPI